jgi:hypothetical protein
MTTSKEEAQLAFDQTISMVDNIKHNPELLEDLTKEYFNPANGHVSQAYADWVNSKEYAQLRLQGVHLSVDEHTTATPSEIIAEFEAIYASFMEDLKNGTAEEITELDD